jgi:succinoglycan biosynthesis transport protein ExoP
MDLTASVPYAQSQIRTYTELAEMPIVLGPVIQDLGLDTTPAELAKVVNARSPVGTIVIEVTATAGSPTKAAAIANGVAHQLAETMQWLTPRTSSGQPAVQVRAVGEAAPPNYPYTPRSRLNVFVALLVGLLVGALTAVQLDATARAAAARGRQELPIGAAMPVSVGGRSAPGAG